VKWPDGEEKLLYYIIAFIMLVAVISFMASPYFQIHEIVIEGLNAIKTSEIQELMAPYYRINILLIDASRIRKELLKSGYIKEITVKKEYPDQLRIVVTERIPLAKINNNGKYLVISKDGYILEEGPLTTKLKIPEISGIGYSLTTNKILFSPVLEKIVQALAEINQESREIMALIKVGKEDISLTLNSRTPVRLGSSEDLIEKFKIIESVLEKIKHEGLKVEYIDISIIGKPVIKLEE